MHRLLFDGLRRRLTPLRSLLFRRWRSALGAATIGAASTAVAVLVPIGSQVPAGAFPADAYAMRYPAGQLSVDPGRLPRRVHAPAPPVATPVTATGPLCGPAALPSRISGIASQSPIALRIPSLQVAAAVEKAGSDRHGDMQVPSSPCDVAWYAPGPAPGAAGDAVMDGHLDSQGRPTIFWGLGQIHRGAEIDVTSASGRQVRFSVQTIRYVSYWSRPSWLFSTTGPPTLSLYTCAGDWNPYARTYEQRVIVTATLLGR